jgi:hypothetical protein
VSLRKVAAAGLIAVWVGVMAWQARRLYLRPETARVASASRLIPPGVAYYSVSRAGRRVGWARSSVDTLPGGTGFRLTDRIVLQLRALAASAGGELPSLGMGAASGGAGGGTGDSSGPSEGDAGTVEILSEAQVGPTLALRSFHASSTGLLGGLSARGEVEGDSLLLLQAADSRGRGHGPVDTVRTRGPIVFENAVPLRVAAEERAGARDSLQVRVFDPLSMAPRIVTLRILQSATRTYPDSADRDSTTGRWVPARLDTVRAWKVAREQGGLSLTSWVDEDGRILEAEMGGLQLRRTAFELAYYGFEALRGAGPDAGAPDSTAGAPDSTRAGPDTTAAPRRRGGDRGGGGGG